jgi:hypothetical protein
VCNKATQLLALQCLIHQQLSDAKGHKNMPLNLQHIQWEPTGRKFEVFDEQNQSYDPPRYCWAGIIGEQQIQDDQGNWQPYIWDNGTNELGFASEDQRIEFASDKQILKKAGNKICESIKLFVQREVSGEWINQPHGLPTKEIRHNKRFKNGDLIDEEGYCIGWLNFPDAQYDLKIGLQVGRRKQGIFGFQFRAPISANIQMQLVKDGIEKDTVNYTLIKSKNGIDTNPERTVGIRYKKFIWRWTYKEAAKRTVEIVDSANYPGQLKATITIGPITYTANEWIKVFPDTWGLTETSDDGLDENGTTFYAHISNLIYLGNGTTFNGGFTWVNVTVPAGATAENGCYLRCYHTRGDFGGGDCDFYAVDARDVAAWSSSNMPVDATRHSNSVAWDVSAGGTGSADSPEMKTILQDRFDDDHQSGDDIGIVGIANAAAASEAWIAAEENTTYDAMQLYIVYTAADAMQLYIVYTAAGADAMPMAMNTYRQMRN